MMLFSKRLELANRSTEWLGNKNLSPVNIVTALDALGALLNSPSEVEKIMNHKSKRPREKRQELLRVKYRWRGMSKTNYRKLGKRMSKKLGSP